MGLESQLELHTTVACKRRRLLTFKLIAVGRRGFPDRIVFFPGGRLIFMELKSPTGQLSVMQVYIHELLTKFGQIVYVPRSKQDINDILERHQHGLPSPQSPSQD
jgi:hypothetical protein